MNVCVSSRDTINITRTWICASRPRPVCVCVCYVHALHVLVICVQCCLVECLLLGLDTVLLLLLLVLVTGSFTDLCSVTMTKATVVLALVILLVSLQCVVGSLEWVQANKNYGSLSSMSRPEPIHHTSRHDILEELWRVRRDGAGSNGQPSATRYVFQQDSHRNGIIQYSGGDSNKVMATAMHTVV